MEIKGLYEKLGIDQSQVDELRRLKVEAAAQRLMFMTQIVGHGGTIHRVNVKQTEKRRAKNKVARKQRRANRG